MGVPWSATRIVVVILAVVILFEAGAAAPASVVAAEPSASPAPGTEPGASPAGSPSPTPAAPAPSGSPVAPPSPLVPPSADPSPPSSPTPDPSPDASRSPDPDDQPPGTERVELRTAHSWTFQQEDGSLITEFFTDAVFYQPDGASEWHPIDLSLEAADAVATPGTETAADVQAVSDDAPAAVSLASADAAEGFVRLAGDGHEIAFALPAELAGAVSSVPVIDGSGRFADYADFLPGGIGLRVFPQADGVKTFLVLPERPATETFSFVVEAPGMTLAVDELGGAVFTDAEGESVGRIPRPFMVDSSSLEGRGGGLFSEAVTLGVSEQDSQTLVTLTVDPAFLDTAVYPVYVDPTTTNFPTGTTSAYDTFASERWPSSNLNTYQRPDSPYYKEMWHGNEPGTSYYNEVYVEFTGLAETLGSVHIDDASLQFMPYWQYYHYQARPTWIRRVTSPWSASTLTWNQRPTTADDLAVGEFDTTEGQWSDADVTDYVQKVIWGDWANEGFMLHADGTGQGNWKRIVSRQDASSYKPKLVVQWSAYTVTAANPTGGAETSTRTLSWSNDLGGPQTWYEAQLSTNNFSTILATSGQIQSADSSWTVPITTSLTPGTTYQWRVRAKFGANTSWTAFSTASFVHRPALNLGLQSHNTFETFDLGNDDTLSVNVANGNGVLSHPIVDLPIRGGSLSIGLTYNSQETANVGMGPGWRLSAMRRIADLGASGAVFTAADGSVHTFTVASVIGTVTTYSRPATIYASLVKDTAQTLEWTLTYRDRTADRFDTSGSSGLLAESADRHGNKVTFSYYSSSDRLYRATDVASSRYVELTWDTTASPARLTSFTDWAYVSGGIVQTSNTGSRRLYRFFYDAGGQLAGWASPLNTADTCPTGGSHLTCLTYSGGLLSTISKRQTYTTLNETTGTLNSVWRSITSTVTYSGGEVAAFRDYLQTSTTETKFTRPAAGQMRVVRVGDPTSTTTYGQVGDATDSLGRMASVWRRLGSTDIEQRTVWDTTYPTEPASVTDNFGSLLNTPARTVSMTYVANSMGLVARITEPLDGTNNRHTDYTYNANNDVAELVVSLNGSATRTVTRYCYTTSGCATNGTSLTMRAQIDNYVDGAKGGSGGNQTDVTTEFLYDSHGQLTRESRFNYDAAGNLLDSRAIGYEYDTYGNLTKEIVNYANGTVSSPGDDITPNAATNARTDLTTVHTHDTGGNRVSGADPRRAIELAKGTSLGADDYVTRWTHDPANQRLTEQAPRDPGDASAPPVSTTTYDEQGRVRRSQDLGGLVTATGFDRNGMPVDTFEDPPGTGTPAVRTSLTTYDAAGRPASLKDERELGDSSLGRTTYDYDTLGRQTAVTEAEGTADEIVTTTAYDALSRQTQSSFGGQTSAYRFDLGGRVIEQDDSFACTHTSYDYRDLALSFSEGLVSGNPCTGPGVRTLTSTYDGLGRLTKSQVTAGEGLNDIPNEVTLDAAGNMLSSSSTSGGVTTSTIHTVNLLDQRTREIRSDGSKDRMNYDPAGNATDRCYWALGPDEACKPVGSSFSNPPTRLTTSKSDARNQRIELVDAATAMTTVYDADHNYEVKATYIPTGAGIEHQSLYSYDDRHRVVTVTHRLCTISSGHSCSSAIATGSDSYVYDHNDNRTQVAESSTGATPTTLHYCYDAQNRLEYRNTGSACSSTAKDESYAYDAAGNRTQAVTGGAATNFAYNGDGQLCAVGAVGCTSPNVTYDDAGRTRHWNGWFFWYDADGRLTRACEDSSCASNEERIEFTYDAEGRRTQIKAAPANGTFTEVNFRYQGGSVVEERDAGGTLLRHYLVDEAGAIVKLVIAAGQPHAGTYLVTWSGHGDAMALHRLNSGGTLTLANSYTYSTWGAPTTATHNSIGDLSFRFLYVGRFGVQWDNVFGLGLQYMQARHYAPAIGRFLQPDPTRLEAGPYVYAVNNPITHIDPTGTCFWCRLPDMINRLQDLIRRGQQLITDVWKIVQNGWTWVQRIWADIQRYRQQLQDLVRFSMNVARFSVTFGRVPNQIYHTFRHTDALGLSRTAVRSAVLSSLRHWQWSLRPGVTINRAIHVGGHQLIYTARRLSDGTIRVGRIVQRSAL